MCERTGDARPSWLALGLCVPSPAAAPSAAAATDTRFACAGHRSGENVLWHSSVSLPQYRENTIRSLREAVRAGAAFVEFDVQVTLDGRAVIW